MTLGIGFWIILFGIAGVFMLKKGMKYGSRSCLADAGRILLILAWICFLGWFVRSCIWPW